jgi:hypothetical protein
MFPDCLMNSVPPAGVNEYAVANDVFVRLWECAVGRGAGKLIEPAIGAEGVEAAAGYSVEIARVPAVPMTVFHCAVKG